MLDFNIDADPDYPKTLFLIEPGVVIPSKEVIQGGDIPVAEQNKVFRVVICFRESFIDIFDFRRMSVFFVSIALL